MAPETTAVRPRLTSRSRLLDLLIDFEIEPGAEFSVTMLTPGAAIPGGWEWLPASAAESGTGLALITDSVPPAEPAPRVALAPPFPVVETGTAGDFSPLRDLLTQEGLHVGIILLRLGHYAVGIACDEVLKVSKTGGRYVKGQHRKGGQSSNRFRRNREVWIQQLFDEVQEIASSRFSSYEHHIDWLALGGDRHVLGRFMSRVNLPDGLSERALPWRVPVERPGRAALDDAVRHAWSSRLYWPPA